MVYMGLSAPTLLEMIQNTSPKCSTSRQASLTGCEGLVAQSMPRTCIEAWSTDHGDKVLRCVLSYMLVFGPDGVGGGYQLYSSGSGCVVVDMPTG